MKQLKHQETLSEAESLDFYFDFKQEPSVKIESSDYIGNQIILKHLVATLLRYGSGGVFQPYLAESWSASSDKKNWSFRLNANFKTERSMAITGNGFKSILSKNLKLLASLGEVPIFNQLVGWEDYISGKADQIVGIISTTEVVTFQFVKPANEGFLEYLCMPYYGYVEYDENSNLISSGPFTLLNIESNPVVLKKRRDFPLKSNGISEVNIFRGNANLDSLLKTSKRLIVQANSPIKIDTSAFTTINGSPDILFSVVLDIGENSFFRDHLRRKVFNSYFKEEIGKTKFVSENSVYTQKLFLDFPEGKSANSPLKNLETVPKSPIRVFSIKSDDPDIIATEDAVLGTLKKLGLKYSVFRFGEDPTLTVKDKISRVKYDIRIVSVYSGPTFDAWVTEMMFCSNLGISFPDPSGKVCQSLQDKDISKDRKILIKSVSEAINLDESVIPVLYKTNIFYLSKNISTQNIQPDTVLIGFDEL